MIKIEASTSDLVYSYTDYTVRMLAKCTCRFMYVLRSKLVMRALYVQILMLRRTVRTCTRLQPCTHVGRYE